VPAVLTQEVRIMMIGLSMDRRRAARGNAHLLLGIAIAFCLAQNAEAATPQEKLCILSAAEKLPRIQGLQILTSDARQSDPKEAVLERINEFKDPLIAAKKLNDEFQFLDERLMADVEQKYASGYFNLVIESVQKELSKTLAGSVRTELKIKAAGQDATFVSFCFWDKAGVSVTTNPIIEQ
jgi:hypothetical protein